VLDRVMRSPRRARPRSCSPGASSRQGGAGSVGGNGPFTLRRRRGDSLSRSVCQARPAALHDRNVPVVRAAPSPRSQVPTDASRVPSRDVTVRSALRVDERAAPARAIRREPPSSARRGPRPDRHVAARGRAHALVLPGVGASADGPPGHRGGQARVGGFPAAAWDARDEVAGPPLRMRRARPGACATKTGVLGDAGEEPFSSRAARRRPRPRRPRPVRGGEVAWRTAARRIQSWGAPGRTAARSREGAGRDKGDPTHGPCGPRSLSVSQAGGRRPALRHATHPPRRTQHGAAVICRTARRRSGEPELPAVNAGRLRRWLAGGTWSSRYRVEPQVSVPITYHFWNGTRPDREHLGDGDNHLRERLDRDETLTREARPRSRDRQSTCDPGRPSTSPPPSPSDRWRGPGQRHSRRIPSTSRSPRT